MWGGVDEREELDHRPDGGEDMVAEWQAGEELRGDRPREHGEHRHGRQVEKDGVVVEVLAGPPDPDDATVQNLPKWSAYAHH